MSLWKTSSSYFRIDESSPSFTACLCFCGSEKGSSNSKGGRENRQLWSSVQRDATPDGLAFRASGINTYLLLQSSSHPQNVILLAKLCFPFFFNFFLFKSFSGPRSSQGPSEAIFRRLFERCRIRGYDLQIQYQVCFSSSSFDNCECWKTEFNFQNFYVDWIEVQLFEIFVRSFQIKERASDAHCQGANVLSLHVAVQQGSTISFEFSFYFFQILFFCTECCCKTWSWWRQRSGIFFTIFTNLIQVERIGSCVYEGEDVVVVLWRLSTLESSAMSYLPAFITKKEVCLFVVTFIISLFISSFHIPFDVRHS